jgi:kynureninase
MNIQELRSTKIELLNEVTILVADHKRRYSNMSIDSPMTKDEKDLTAKIALLWGHINQIVKQINKAQKI